MWRRSSNEIGGHYGSNPTVWGWQLDNEMSHYGQGMSYSPAAEEKFRAWLREKYGTIARLNTDWGNSFWSQMYNVSAKWKCRMRTSWWPTRTRTRCSTCTAGLRRKRPTIFVFKRWSCAVTCRTNGSRRTSSMNYYLTNPALSEKDFDIMSFTMYPVSGGLFRGELGFRMGDPAQVSFTHDFLRNLGSGIEGPMELQPGQVNWAPVNPWPQPGVIHAWIMRAFGLGARFVCVYRYRQPLFGDELYHRTMVEPDGVTLAPGGKEFVQAIQEVQALRKLYRPHATQPKEYAARRTAFLYNWDNRWDMENHKQTTRWDTMEHWMKYYRAMKSMMAPVDVISEDKDFSKYPFVIAPSYQLIDKELIARFKAYAENGGTLILTCRTGQKDRRGHIWESLWAEPIYDLAGAAIPKYDVLPEGRDGKVTAGEKSYAWGSWGDILEPRPGTEVLATYADQFYKGSAAATRHRLGKGQVVYIGVDSITGELEADLLSNVYKAAGANPARLPLNFMVDWRDGFWVATNFTDNDQKIPAAAGAKVLVGGRTIPPGGVAIWQ